MSANAEAVVQLRPFEPGNAFQAQRHGINSIASNTYSIAVMSAGRDHTLALLVDGNVIGWGGDGSARSLRSAASKEWTVYNTNNMRHPFHIHTILGRYDRAAAVRLSRGADLGDLPNPLSRLQGCVRLPLPHGRARGHGDDADGRGGLRNRACHGVNVPGKTHSSSAVIVT